MSLPLSPELELHCREFGPGMEWNSGCDGVEMTYRILELHTWIRQTKSLHTLFEIFIYLTRPSLSCSTQDPQAPLWQEPQLWHGGSSSLTRDGTQAPCIGSTESQPLDHQGIPPCAHLKLPLSSQARIHSCKWQIRLGNFLWSCHLLLFPYSWL